ncbi:Coenzyme PQQ synthesis protein B [subsurface metagenome]|nr:pyrroloquinoline quinone biosynthesis protein PqqB [bacterium]
MKKMKRREFLNTVLWGAAGSSLILPSVNLKKLPKSSDKPQEETSVLAQVLGTAQDGGIPQIGCYCRNCLRAREDARFTRLVSSIALIDFIEKKYFILDATPDIRLQSDRALARLGIDKGGRKNAPDAILLTHAHIGHYTGLMFFGYEAMSTQNLPVHCTSRMGRFLSDNGPWSQLISLENISLRTLHPGKELSLTSRISLTPFLVPHRNEYSDTIGFRISGEKKKLLYIPDIQSWKAWNRSIVEEAEKVDIALLDGTFYNPEELPGRDLSKIGHPLIQTSLKTLGKVAQKGQTQICFIHLNHTNLALDPEGEARKEITNRDFRLASDGEEFSL